ncbi:hypothetical protein HY967_04915, partial [Candidatus Jorgensenbacteria bacterium]|nr:hypothetical protein [Candidatus Jorgensenbacteria bacterium]
TVNPEIAERILDAWMLIDRENPTQLAPGVKTMLECLVRHHHLTILSGRSWASLYTQLKRLGILKYFSIVQANEALWVHPTKRRLCKKKRVFYNKPDPNTLGFHLIHLKNMGVEKSVFVDDGVDNSAMARPFKNRGVMFVGISANGCNTPRFLRAGIPKKQVINKITKLPKLLRSTGKANYC